MARIVSTEALVLRTRPYRETSKLVTLFTRDFGRVHLHAKGARRPRSKFGAALEVLSHIRVIFYRSEQKHIYTMSDAAIIRDLPRMRSEPARLRAALVAGHFADRNFESEVPHIGVFRLLRELLSVLDSGRGDPVAAVHAFLFKASEQMGYAPRLDGCVCCGRCIATCCGDLGIAIGSRAIRRGERP